MKILILIIKFNYTVNFFINFISICTVASTLFADIS